jgi:hypothetical protein
MTFQKHTLLSRAVSHVQCSISTVGAISAGVELLVATALERSTDVDKGISLDGKRALSVAGVQNGGRSDASECGGESLKITSSLAAVRCESGRRAESSGDERGDDECGLHDCAW